MSKAGRVRCGRWEGRLGDRCGRVLRDDAGSDPRQRMTKDERARWKELESDRSGEWWHHARLLGQVEDRERDQGRYVTRAGIVHWETICRCGAHYCTDAATLRRRVDAARSAGEDVWLDDDDRDTPERRP